MAFDKPGDNWRFAGMMLKFGRTRYNVPDGKNKIGEEELFSLNPKPVRGKRNLSTGEKEFFVHAFDTRGRLPRTTFASSMEMKVRGLPEECT